MLTHESQSKYATCTLTLLSKLKDFSRLHAVIHAVNVVLSQKWCKIETLLLPITNKSRTISGELQ